LLWSRGLFVGFMQGGKQAGKEVRIYMSESIIMDIIVVGIYTILMLMKIAPIGLCIRRGNV
jgi:hypothetical protein